MRIVTTTALISLLAVSGAFAADIGPLASGKPAGVHQAQMLDVSPIVYFGVIAVGLGVAYAVTHDQNNNSVVAPPVTATSTSGTTV
jgi:hypothetical protein